MEVPVTICGPPSRLTRWPTSRNALAGFKAGSAGTGREAAFAARAP